MEQRTVLQSFMLWRDTPKLNPKTASVNQMLYFQHTRQSCPSKPKERQVGVALRDPSPDLDFRSIFGELLDRIQRIVAAQRDCKCSPINTLLQIGLPPICIKCSKAKLNLRTILCHRLIPTENPLIRKSLLAAKNELACSLGLLCIVAWRRKGRWSYNQTPRKRETGRRRKYRRVRFKAPTFSEDSREYMDRIVVGG